MIFRKLATTLALTSLMATSAAQAAETNACIPEQEAEALFTYLLPVALDEVRTQCAATLPATAALMDRDSDQFSGYVAASNAAWPNAQEAVRIIAGKDLPPGLDMNLMRPLIDAMVGPMLAGEIKNKDCGMVEKIYSDLAPLPAQNVASLIVTIAGEEMKNDKSEKFRICKAADQ